MRMRREVRWGHWPGMPGVITAGRRALCLLPGDLPGIRPGHEEHSPCGLCSAMRFPPLRLCHGTPDGHRDESIRVRNAGMLPCIILRTPVSAGASGGALTLPEEPGVRRKTVILFLFFCALFRAPGRRAAGRGQDPQLRADACRLHLSLKELPQDPGGNGPVAWCPTVPGRCGCRPRELTLALGNGLYPCPHRGSACCLRACGMLLLVSALLSTGLTAFPAVPGLSGEARCRETDGAGLGRCARCGSPLYSSP